MFHCDDLKREDLNSKNVRLIDLKHQHHRLPAVLRELAVFVNPRVEFKRQIQKQQNR